MVGHKTTFFLQRSVVTKDIIGGMSKVWKTVASLQGSFVSYSRDSRDAEKIIYNKETIDADNFILFDTTVNIKPKDRLVTQNRLFNVVYVEDVNMVGLVRKVSVKEVYDGQV